MVCYKPNQAYIAGVKANGKKDIRWKETPGGEPLKLPCGQCIGCRLKHSVQWGIRCMHEASLYDDNCFITLTYNDENNPITLVKKHCQDFIKRLRKKFGNGIRFYYCGEYGDLSYRPHYHLCCFNHDFSDKELYRVTKEGHRLYTSPSLTSLWPYGFSSVGSMTLQSACYVARYATKKWKSKKDCDFPRGTCTNIETGEIFQMVDEYADMSRRPGIGSDWYENFKDDLFPKDFITLNGRKHSVPRFYDKKFEFDDAEAFEMIKRERLLSIERRGETPFDRLEVMHKCKQLAADRLVRNHDVDVRRSPIKKL